MSQGVITQGLPIAQQFESIQEILLGKRPALPLNSIAPNPK